MGKVNIKQIAATANVSVSTVSRVINGHEYVSEETRGKVQKAIEQFGYQPATAAQSLAGKRSKTLAVFFPYKFKVGDDIFALDHMICYRHVNAILAAAACAGYKLVTSIITDLNDSEQVRLVRRSFYQGSVDAGLFIEFDSPCPIIEEITQAGYIVGALDLNPSHAETTRCIIHNYADFSQGIESVFYLVGMGHSRIGVLGGPAVKWSGESRLRGVLQGFQDVGLPPVWLKRVRFDAQSSYQTMRELMREEREMPTAIICANDAIAFGAMQALSERGVAIPQDISLLGVDGHTMSAYVNPPLTTFYMDFEKVLKELTERVIHAIDNPPDTQLVYEYRFSFIERKSVTRPAQGDRFG
jgi:LacI family transcriptional regulator